MFTNLQPPPKRTFSWKTALFLSALIIPACYLVLPYLFQVQSIALDPAQLRAFLPRVMISAGLYSALAFAGLFLGSRIGFGLPIVESWLEKKPGPARVKDLIAPAVILGVGASVLILAANALVFKPLLSAELAAAGVTLPQEIAPKPWQGLLASFYGGIVEEVQMRLFILTVLSWLGWLAFKDADGRPKAFVVWIAITLAAVVFGLGHVPGMAAIGVPITPLVIARAIVLNGIGGVAFGWLYWKRGLESAIIAHFSADITVHVLVPLLGILLGKA